MSLNHITSSLTYNPWMNISCNDLKCKTLTSDSQTFNGAITVNETTPSSFNGNLANNVDILLLNNTNPSTAGGTAVCLDCKTSGGTLKLGQTLTSPAVSTLISDNKMNIATSANFNIVMSPNNTTVFNASPTTILLAPSGSTVCNVTSTGLAVTGRTSCSLQPYFELKNSGAIAIANSSTTTIINLSTTTQVSSQITYNVGTGVFSVAQDGIYQISYTTAWQGVNTGSRLAYIDKIGSGNLFAYTAVNNVSSDVVSNSSSVALKLLSTDTFSLKVAQNSGGPVNLSEVQVTVTQLS